MFSKVNVDIVKYRKIWFGISLLITIPGVLGIIACMSKATQKSPSFTSITSSSTSMPRLPLLMRLVIQQR